MANLAAFLKALKEVPKGAVREVVNLTEPAVKESGLISPTAEKFSGVRRYLQELGGTGAETEASKAYQDAIKTQQKADEINQARQLQEKTFENKPSPEQLALDRYMIERKLNNFPDRNAPLDPSALADKLPGDTTFDLKKDRRK